MTIKNIISKIIFILILLGSLLFITCKKEDKNSQIPNVYVNFTINLNDPSYMLLNSIGNSLVVNGGVKGIIIYKASENDFVALERVSSYKPEDLCVVDVDSTGIYVVDPCSMSKFLILDGSVINGPAVMPLKRYNTEYDNLINTLHVFN